MAGFDELELVVVTPEKTVLSETVRALRFPLFDGQVGVLPGRAPLVGRLGYGELKITDAGGERSYYLDGGFVQIKGSVVSLLTNRALTTEEIDAQAAQADLASAVARVATTDAEQSARFRDQQRARQMLAMAKSSG